VTEWFEQWFGEEYLRLYPHRDDDDAAAAVALIDRLYPLSRLRALDLACGPGRHAAQLAARGARVTGLDLSLPLLSLARARTRGAVSLVRADMRHLPFCAGAFDVVVNLFTSFGYFADDAQHAAVIAGSRALLRRGGVFVLDYPVPAGQDRLAYRIVVDGLWMTDPSNPAVEIDERGVEVSMYQVETELQRSIVNPDVKAGRATFVYRGTPGTRVSLVGDFNGWDPFAELMTEQTPGEFTATVEVRPGRHYYAYYAGGRKVLDEANGETSVDRDGRRVSTFTVPYTPSY